jgi:UDP-N-acetylmuramyl tripeptide synthase
MRLRAEIALARAVAGLSRLAGRGGGTTLPGKLVATVDPGAIARLARRLPLGCAVVSATNGKTTTTAMAAEILRPRVRLAHNRSGANLVSGVASTLLSANGAELGLFEVDEGAFPDVAARVRPRVVCLGNLFRDQLDRYGELELIAAGWRGAVDRLADEAWLLVNCDDPQVGDLGLGRERRVVFGLDDPGQARPSLQHAADSKFCLRCGAPYAYRAAYVGHLGDYACPSCGHSRPHLDIAARSVEPRGFAGTSFDLVLPEETRRIELRLPGLYNVYNALAAAALARALGATPAEIQTGLEGFSAAFGRFEVIEMGERELLVLLIKNPAGANEAVRTLVEAGSPTRLVVALNDEIADGRDVSWIWDVDFEPLFDGLETLVATGGRAAELALRFRYGGFAGQTEVVSDLAAALDRGLELTPAGGRLVLLPTYTAMLALRKIVAGRGFVRPYWEPSAQSASHFPRDREDPSPRSGARRKRFHK